MFERGRNKDGVGGETQVRIECDDAPAIAARARATAAATAAQTGAAAVLGFTLPDDTQ